MIRAAASLASAYVAYLRAKLWLWRETEKARRQDVSLMDVM